MDPLSFLYIALGVGFLLLVIFGCVVLVYVAQVLRDVTKITDSVRDTAERVNDYVVQPFAMVNNIVDHVRPMIEAVIRRKNQMQHDMNESAHKSAKAYKKRAKKRSS